MFLVSLVQSRQSAYPASRVVRPREGAVSAGPGIVPASAALVLLAERRSEAGRRAFSLRAAAVLRLATDIVGSGPAMGIERSRPTIGPPGMRRPPCKGSRLEQVALGVPSGATLWHPLEGPDQLGARRASLPDL